MAVICLTENRFYSLLSEAIYKAINEISEQQDSFYPTVEWMQQTYQANSTISYPISANSQ